MSQVDTTASRPPVVELHFEDREGRVRIVPANRDLMTIPVAMAIEACRAFNQQIVFKDQFDMLVDCLGRWINGHREQIGDAYLTIRDAGLLFLVVHRATSYDDAFESALTDLDLEIANDDDYGLINLSVLGLPSVDEQSVHTFLSNKMALRYQVHGGRS